MRDRTKRFTVGLGLASNHLQILAADVKTTTWANKNRYVMTVITRKISDQLVAAKLETEEREAWMPPAPEGTRTLASLRAEFAALLEAAFPEELFAVTAPPTPRHLPGPAPHADDLPALIAKLSGASD